MVAGEQIEFAERSDCRSTSQLQSRRLAAALSHRIVSRRQSEWVHSRSQATAPYRLSVAKMLNLFRQRSSDRSNSIGLLCSLDSIVRDSGVVVNGPAFLSAERERSPEINKPAPRAAGPPRAIQFISREVNYNEQRAGRANANAAPYGASSKLFQFSSVRLSLMPWPVSSLPVKLRRLQCFRARLRGDQKIRVRRQLVVCLFVCPFAAIGFHLSWPRQPARIESAPPSLGKNDASSSRLDLFNSHLT